MTCSNYCGHNDHRPCVDYIPCVGPTGPAGPTATNQFLSVGAGAGTSALPTTLTPINFTIANASNGTNITGSVPTTVISLAPNHSYFISYNVNAKTTAGEESGGATLTASLLLNGSTQLTSTSSNTGLTPSISVAGGTIVTVGATAATLSLEVSGTPAAGAVTLANANISIIELL